MWNTVCATATAFRTGLHGAAATLGTAKKGLFGHGRSPAKSWENTGKTLGKPYVYIYIWYIY